MSMDRSYNAVTGRKSQIIRDAIGVDYSKYEKLRWGLSRRMYASERNQEGIS